MIYFYGLFLAYAVFQATTVRLVLARVRSAGWRAAILVPLIVAFPVACWLAALVSNGGDWVFGLLAMGASWAALLGSGAGFVWYIISRAKAK